MKAEASGSWAVKICCSGKAPQCSTSAASHRRQSPGRGGTALARIKALSPAGIQVGDLLDERGSEKRGPVPILLGGYKAAARDSSWRDGAGYQGERGVLSGVGKQMVSRIIPITPARIA
jgi:hypothetical protein